MTYITASEVLLHYSLIEAQPAFTTTAISRLVVAATVFLEINWFDRAQKWSRTENGGGGFPGLF
ncbi:MAG: hypothetical protein R2681_01550 [Pyrinomonadaceae bacterium]